VHNIQSFRYLRKINNPFAADAIITRPAQRNRRSRDASRAAAKGKRAGICAARKFNSRAACAATGEISAAAAPLPTQKSFSCVGRQTRRRKVRSTTARPRHLCAAGAQKRHRRHFNRRQICVAADNQRAR